MENEKKSPTEENKALVLQFFSAIENNKMDLFDKIVAKDYDDHLPGQTSGREVLKKYFVGLHAAFADLQLPVWAMVAEGDKVAVHNSIKGIHRADYGGFKAKGNPVNALAFQLYRIENRQLAEHWEVADFATLVQQIQA
ncbi:ester cyclase [Mucilaginibacter sp. X4EP1]|uniref:ester cyclase n=1 Tax=Mucilaginibacter sp. X4EP1 TaxID=2723092 RepID=UPI002168DC8E|nr:ester cyclase [Mucilaginibacter sp. X4EP1]MCS3812018.1 putative SnoaL-like aldol condensation-catalyzing enzyme [Mucilaginibacter sp. X4EP1]